MDFDGTINDNVWCSTTAYQTKQMVVEPSKVAHLNAIVAGSGARVVFSTAWRSWNTAAKLREIMQKAGYAGKFLPEGIGVTPLLGRPRCDEIETWLIDAGPILAEHGYCVDSYVILDDDFAAGPKGRHAFRHIRTRPEVGLTAADVEKALNVLSVTL